MDVGVDVDVKVGVVRRFLDPVVVSFWLLVHRRRPARIACRPEPVPAGV